VGNPALKAIENQMTMSAIVIADPSSMKPAALAISRRFN
jgi:hypothetical protein